MISVRFPCRNVLKISVLKENNKNAYVTELFSGLKLLLKALDARILIVIYTGLIMFFIVSCSKLLYLSFIYACLRLGHCYFSLSCIFYVIFKEPPEDALQEMYSKTWSLAGINASRIAMGIQIALPPNTGKPMFPR